MKFFNYLALSKNHKYYLVVEDFRVSYPETEYEVYYNENDDEENYVLVCKFTFEYIRDKMYFDITNDGKYITIAYGTKKGVFLFSGENGNILWNNSKVKSIKKVKFDKTDNFIEVIHTKLNSTYLNKENGEVTKDEELTAVRQKISSWVSSQNGKYILATKHQTDRDIARFTLYDGESFAAKSTFLAPFANGGSRCAVSNDGNYAICTAYKTEGMQLINTQDCQVLWERKDISHIQSVCFDKEDNYVYVSNNDGVTYELSVKTGNQTKLITADKFIPNSYGEDICIIDRNLAVIGKKKIKSPNFAWLRAVPAENCVALISAGGEDMMVYDYNSNLLWKNSNMEINKVFYLTFERLFAVVTAKEIILMSPNNGKIISSCSLSEERSGYDAILADGGRSIITNTYYNLDGDVYEINNSVVEKSERKFEFKIIK